MYASPSLAIRRSLRLRIGDSWAGCAALAGDAASSGSVMTSAGMTESSFAGVQAARLEPIKMLEDSWAGCSALAGDAAPRESAMTSGGMIGSSFGVVRAARLESIKMLEGLSRVGVATDARGSIKRVHVQTANASKL